MLDDIDRRILRNLQASPIWLRPIWQRVSERRRLWLASGTAHERRGRDPRRRERISTGQRLVMR